MCQIDTNNWRNLELLGIESNRRKLKKIYVVATSFPGFSFTRPYGGEREPGSKVDVVVNYLCRVIFLFLLF